MKKRYYYIAADGSKKKYIGHVYHKADGTMSGVLTTHTKGTKEVMLEHHDAIEQVDGWDEYYTYLDAQGHEHAWHGAVLEDESGLYFMNTTQVDIDLVRHPQVDHHEEYFTYVGPDGAEHVFEGTPEYDATSQAYTGKL